MVKIKQQYDVLFHHMTQGAFFQAKNSSLIDVNSAALKMFGLTREQFLGRTSLHPEWKVVKEDGSDLAPEQHPSMIALRTGQEVADVIVGVYNPLHRDFTWLNVNATPLFRENEDTPYQVFVTLHDLSSTLQMKALYQSRLNLIECADSQTLEELLVYTLDEVEKLTNSRIGFYHFYDSETQAISLNAWSTKTTELFCQVSDAQGHYPLAQAGVWVDCVREDRPVIHNDYESLPHRKGLPEGHAPLIRELVVPVKRHGQIVALLGVGNKPANYTESDLSTVMLFADLAWDIAEKKSVPKKPCENPRVSSQKLKGLAKSEGGSSISIPGNRFGRKRSTVFTKSHPTMNRT